MTNELKQFETKNLRNDFIIFQNLTVFLLAFIYGIFVDYKITFFFLIASIQPLLLAKLFKRKIVEASQSWTLANGNYTGSLNDVLGGADTIMNYDGFRTVKLKFSQSSTKLEKALNKMSNQVEISNQITITLANICLFSFAFGFGIYQVIKGNILLGSFMSLLQISNYLVNPILNVITSLNEKRTTTYLSILILKTAQTSERKKYAQQELAKASDINIENGELRLGEQVLFKHLNLVINPGEKVLITAPSGFGKSTLLRAISGFIPFDDGDYCLAGQNVKQMSKAALMTHFSLMKQQPFIFDDTILFNLIMGKSYSMEEIEKTVVASGLSEIIATKGFEFQVGE